MKAGTACGLLLLVVAAWSLPTLNVAYRRDVRAAPLYDACLYGREFRARYGLYLKPVRERPTYTLVDRRKAVLSIDLVSCDSDSAVLAALLSGTALVGILGSDEALGAVLKDMPVRIVAPLERAADQLIVGTAPVADWRGFVDWVKGRSLTTVGYVGQYSSPALGFAQALAHEGIRSTMEVPGISARTESAQVRLVRAGDERLLAREISSGSLDAALLEEPSATFVSVLRGCRKIARTDLLPPGRFEGRAGTVIAAGSPGIRDRGETISRFLELMAVATHYANNRTRNTLTAACRWLGTSPALESIPLAEIGLSSRPDVAFTSGIWNWYFALRLRNAVPENLAGFMEEKDWLGVPYDSLLLMPALDRAGARIIR